MTPDRVKFRSNNVVAGRPYVLYPIDAKLLLRRAAELRLPVRSVVGLIIGPGDRIRSTEHVEDFSAALAQGEGSWEAAEQFITDRDLLDLVFEVTLGHHLDHAV